MFLIRFNKFISYFGQDFKIKLIYMFFMSFMSSLLEFLSIILVFPFLMILINPSRVIHNPIAVFFKNLLHIDGINNLILLFGSLIAVAIIIKNLYCILIQYWQSKLISQWGLEIKEKLLEFYLYSPYETDLQKGDSNRITKMFTTVNEVMKYFTSKVISFISNSFVIILILLVLIYLLPGFTILAIVFFSIAGLIQANFFKKCSERLAIKKKILTNGPITSLMNNLKRVKDIKINGCQKYFFNKYDKISEKAIPYDEKLDLIPSIPQYIVEIIFVFTMTILCLGILVQYGENPNNIIITFGIIAIAIYRLVPQIYKNQVYMNYINITTTKVEDLFKIYDAYRLYDYSKNKDTKDKMTFEKNLVIQNLNYSYDKKENVLHNINLTINKGEFIGIVGLSGAGKSTLVDCILGLLDYEGSIFIDNELINADNVQKFRNIIGYVPQKTVTVEGDIYTNVAWGIERKDIDKEKADEVLKAAQLYDQLKQTENGLEIELKQDGPGLSGGQMQRIGIARALYREPEIIVLDEATANLDVKIESKLTEILYKLKGNKTIIAIAHRLSTLLNCDRIVYVKEGTVVDIGTFHDLAQKYEDFNEIVKLSKIKIDEIEEES